MHVKSLVAGSLTIVLQSPSSPTLRTFFKFVKKCFLQFRIKVEKDFETITNVRPAPSLVCNVREGVELIQVGDTFELGILFC